jgi:hypothetical protein
MAVRYSTGLRDKMLGSESFLEAFTNGVLRIYSGAQPVNADAATSGTLLLEITVGGGAFSHGSPTNGLNFDAPVSAVLSKAAAEAWSGIGVAAGVAGWARLSGNPLDSGGSSTTLARVDMSVAKTGADLNLSNTTVAIGAPQTIDVFSMAMPAQ